MIRPSMTDATSLACAALLSLCLEACGARSQLLGERDVATVDVAMDVLDAGGGVDGRACGCPGTSGFRVCVLPLMCCPVTRTCEDPARFNCTGSNPPGCP